MKDNTVITLLIMGLGYLFFGFMYSALICVSQIAMENYMYSAIIGTISFIHAVGLYFGLKGLNNA